MKYLSVCAGIEAATVAWHHMGWEAAGFSEIEKFPSQVLDHHYPDVPKLGDMTRYKEWDIGTIDLLVGGTPCQSFSVAGLRKGMADPRGNLALVYCGILDHFRPQWFVWENVPGVLSSNGGRDFGSFLGAVAELGYGFAYRVLDSQWFGVAQRRRRVFVVGCLGDWRRAAAVLFEPQSLRRDLAPSREAWQKAAPTVVQGSPYSSTGNERVECDAIVASIYPTLNASDGDKWGCNQWVDEGKAIVQPIALAENTIGRQPQNGGNGDGFTVGGPMYTLNATGVHGVAQPIPLDLRNAGRDPEKHDEMNRQGLGVGNEGDPAHTVTTACVHGVAHPTAYSFDSLASNSMKSSNPNSGCRMVDVSKTLDTTTPGPSKNQGGIAVVQPTVLMDQGGSVMNVLQDGTVGTLRRETHGHEPIVAQPIAFAQNSRDEVRLVGGDGGIVGALAAQPGMKQTTYLAQPVAPTLTASNDPSRSPQSTEITNQVASVYAASMAVRRLTPIECERLQGFPDGYTDIQPNGKPTPDGPRYKALGNSMAVPVMKWIGERIAAVNDLI